MHYQAGAPGARSSLRELFDSKTSFNLSRFFRQPRWFDASGTSGTRLGILVGRISNRLGARRFRSAVRPEPVATADCSSESGKHEKDGSRFEKSVHLIAPRFPHLNGMNRFDFEGRGLSQNF